MSLIVYDIPHAPDPPDLPLDLVDQALYGLTRLPIDAPPMFEDALRYFGRERYIALRWKAGTFCYQGPFFSAAASQYAWAAWSGHMIVLPELLPFALGSAEQDSLDWLLLDRSTLALYAGSSTAAWSFLRSQTEARPRPDPAVQLPDGRTVMLDHNDPDAHDRFVEALWRRLRYDLGSDETQSISPNREPERRAVAAMTEWLDGLITPPIRERYYAIMRLMLISACSTPAVTRHSE